MASISAGTRNLKFMQRGIQLPLNPTSGSSRATSATAQPIPNNRTPTSIPNATPAEQAEEEQWVLPTRRPTLTKGKGKPSGDRSSQTTSARPRVVVTSESSYLAFVGPESTTSGLDDQSSDEDMEGNGVIPSGGRLTFGTIPSKQTLDTSIVDNREKMSHAKATTTASDRFAVFSTPNGEASSSRRKGEGEDRKSKRDERKRTSDPEDGKNAARETDNTPSTSNRKTKQGFLRPSNFDDIPHNSKSQPARQQNETSATASKRNGKKRKSDQLTEEGEVLAQGARARGKKSKKQGKGDEKPSEIAEAKPEGKKKSRDLDHDAMAAEIAGGDMDDDEVERYLEDVMQEMRDD